MYMYTMLLEKSLLKAITIQSTSLPPTHTMILVLSVNIVRNVILPWLLLLTGEDSVMMSSSMSQIKILCSNYKQGF